MKERLDGMTIRGRGRLVATLPDGSQILREFRNATMRDWARVAVPFYSLQAGLPVIPINLMYLEFVNAPAPIAVPTFSRTDPDAARPYYDALSGSPTKDFLRVPITMAGAFNDPSEGDTEFNAVRFVSRSEGIVGVHGKDFEGGTSVLIGAALVAAPDLGDQAQDIVHSRAYVDSGDQLELPVGAQVHAEWELTFD